MKEKEYKYLVGVRCFTFNQSKYILDALNGFVMQQTNFPFVVMVVDDASTDGEQEVIRQFVTEQFDLTDINVAYEKETDYAHITYAQHKINKNCYIAVLYLKENHYSQKRSEEKFKYLSEWRDYIKYEALCKGDDYWIHPKKLQMQVDFLEENEEYSMCFHNAIIYHDDTNKKSRIFCDIMECREVSLEEIIDSWVAPTASLMYRKNIVNNYPIWTQRIYSGDLTLQLVAYSKGKLYFFKNIMSVYRQTFFTDSISSKLKTKPSDFVFKQHSLLFKLYDEYTDYKYHNILKKRIKFKDKCARFEKYRQKKLLYAAFRMPIFFLKKLIHKLLCFQK